jgi:hypothetical protein
MAERAREGGGILGDTYACDWIARRLTAGTSRRGVVGSVLGGVALLAAADTLMAKPGGTGKSTGKGPEKRTSKRQGKGQGKVWLCHQPDPTTGLGGTVIQVAASAKGEPHRPNILRGHLRHGDVECPVRTQAYLKGDPCTVSGGVATCAPLG